MESARKVRYAVVGLGDIAQRSMLPAVAHTRNSQVTALVTGNREKALRLGRAYHVVATYDYEHFDDLLRSGDIDAVYLATPNWRHAEFAIPALRAGIHVLVEKPLEVTSSRGQRILDAQRRSAAKLMVAYRLHFEPATLALIKAVHAGQLGHVHLFSSTFAQMIDPDNHRASSGEAAGPLFDMGPYPVNAARSVFRAEPVRVVCARATRHPQSGVRDAADTVAATLEFPDGRLAQMIVSYYGNGADSLQVVGTRGSILLRPAYTYGAPLEQWLTRGHTTQQRSFPATDQFGGEMKYFSDCILQQRDPEPDAREGLADLLVLEAIQQALSSRESVDVVPLATAKGVVANLPQHLPPVRPDVAEVQAHSPVLET
jgi:predicted dehydrogenase